MNNSRLVLGVSLSMIGCGTGTTEEKAVQLEDEDSGQSLTESDTNSSNDPEDTGEALPGA